MGQNLRPIMTQNSQIERFFNKEITLINRLTSRSQLTIFY